MGTSVKKETLSGMKWTAIETFSLDGINFVLGLLLARMLLPSDFGTVAMIGIFISVSNTFASSGFKNALIRKIDRTEVDYSTVFYFNIVVSVICYGILFVCAPWVADFFHTPIVCDILRVQSLAIIFSAFCLVQNARLTIAIDFKTLAKRSLLASLISAVVGVVMAYTGFGVWSLVAQNLVAKLVNTVFLWTYCKWKPLWTFSWKSFHELFSYGSKLMLSGLLNTFYNNLNSIVIGRYFSSSALGYYNRGTNFARFPVRTMKSVLQRVTFPILAKLQNDDHRLVAVYRKYIRMTSMVIFFSCILLGAMAKPVIIFLITEKWMKSIIYLQIFTFSIMFDHISAINLNLLQVKGRSDLFLRLEIIKKAIAVGILFSAIPFGVLGICISKVIYAQIATFINTYYTGKLFNLGYVTQVKDFSGYFFKSLIACTPAYLFTFLELPHIVSILFGLITGPALYWLMLRKNEDMLELISLARNAIHKKGNKDAKSQED